MSGTSLQIMPMNSVTRSSRRDTLHFFAPFLTIRMHCFQNLIIKAQFRYGGTITLIGMQCEIFQIPTEYHSMIMLFPRLGYEFCSLSYLVLISTLIPHRPLSLKMVYCKNYRTRAQSSLNLYVNNMQQLGRNSHQSLVLSCSMKPRSSHSSQQTTGS